MLPIEPLGLRSTQWQFLTDPERYVAATADTERALVPESTRRQFLTAQDILERLNGSNSIPPRRGILLADDVGLGKTTVAALVAWVVAGAEGSPRCKVRVLAPNDVMVRRWTEELQAHVKPLQLCAPRLYVKDSYIKARRMKTLAAGSIQVVKHSYAASKSPLSCDLLIIDEAHRAKGEGSEFSRALKRQRKYARRVLILTATPFSIHIKELLRMLMLIGGEDANAAVRSFDAALNDLYRGDASRPAERVAERLAKKAQAAVEALRLSVIRHGIDDLPREQGAFGAHDDWRFAVPEATPDEVELMLRMDRARRVARQPGEPGMRASADPRYDVGWQHFDNVRAALKKQAPFYAEPARGVVESHLVAIKRLRGKVGVHSKIAAVAEEVCATVERGEKVALFCHHHATAQELTVHLHQALAQTSVPRMPGPDKWCLAWNAVLAPAVEERHEMRLRSTFINWLCADLIRSQTWAWLRREGVKASDLIGGLTATVARDQRGTVTVAEAAQSLFLALLASPSSRAVLNEADRNLAYMPGANGASRVLAVCQPTGAPSEEALFVHNQQPDTIISIFNSPFGPDALVVTDKLSEGVDLHRYCRHLVHYELDPSPIRTVQRNGRLRRVNCWAATIGEPIRYAYPAFRGTRDYRLVQIMKKRINNFALLLGGVQDFDVDEIVGSEEEWRNRVVALAKTQLAKAGGQLRTPYLDLASRKTERTTGRM